MSAPSRAKQSRPLSVHRFRWVFQTVFLLLFLGLLTMTVWPLGTVFLGGFLLSDPLMTINSLAQGVVKWELLLALPVLLSPLFLGRVFCGYVCPMGFLIELFGPKKERHPGLRARKILRRVPLFGLVVVVMLITHGERRVSGVRPALAVHPQYDHARLPRSRPGAAAGRRSPLPSPQLQGSVDSVTTFSPAASCSPTGWLTSCSWSSWPVRRVCRDLVHRAALWCRHLCPLGALLGLVGRGAIFGRVVDEKQMLRVRGLRGGLPHGCHPGRRPLHRHLALPGRPGVRRRLLEGRGPWGFKPRKQHVHDPSRRALLKGAGAGLRRKLLPLHGPQSHPAQRLPHQAARLSSGAGLSRHLRPLRPVSEGLSHQRAAAGRL